MRSDEIISFSSSMGIVWPSKPCMKRQTQYTVYSTSYTLYIIHVTVYFFNGFQVYVSQESRLGLLFALPIPSCGLTICPCRWLLLTRQQTSLCVQDK
jgi:hypothetical protein